MTTDLWWKHGTIYQIYPRSFHDGNGDGIGDIEGIRSKLDYLSWLGIDAIWISPIFQSPMADFGYDISDYQAVDPIFGGLDDVDRLLAEAHGRGIKVLLDLVPNHTSDRHRWFLESRSGRGSARRDWYMWRDPAPGGGPPNNWLSVFGGSAWTLDPASGQYYYHAFLPEQPDLNWRNRDVREAMHATMRFWLDRGVDGFRVDVIWHLIKDDLFRDNPVNHHYKPGQSPYARLNPEYSSDRPEVHEVIAEMRAVLDGYPDARLLIGEIYLPVERLMTYYGADLGGVHLPFNFQLLQTAWNAPAIAALIRDYEDALPQNGWPNWVLGNHDTSRIATRVGPAQARIAAMLLLTLRGTPTLYYGDEIGMADVSIPADRTQDPVGRRIPGLGLGRDPERTPMRWNDGPGAGFTTAEPWLPIGPDTAIINVAAQERDPHSMLSLHRRLLQVRREQPALRTGAWRLAHCGARSLTYERYEASQRILVALNLGAEPVDAATVPGAGGRILVSTHLDREGEVVKDTVALRADEGIVIG